MKVIRVARLDLPVASTEFQAEVAALPDRWMPHFQKLHYEGGWTVLPLRSLEGNLDEKFPFALGGRPANYAATPLLALCPAIGAFLDSLSCPVLSARLLNLRSGSVIKPHQDMELAFENGEARLHIPIFTNPEVEFVIDDERVVMEPGTCWYINANLMHHVTNRGASDRIHLVVDCVVDDWLRAQFAKAETHYSEQRRDPQELRQIIARLREMDLPAVPALIAELEEELAGAERG